MSNYGKTITNGVANYLSASSLQKADPTTGTGCLRAWKYHYEFGLREPPSKAMLHGIKIHGEIETYLKTGERAHLSSLVLAAMHMIPKPGPDLLVEHPIVPEDADGVAQLALAPVRFRGIPVVGKIDLMHARGTNQGTNEVGEIHDPPNTAEVIDWKTTSRLSNAKSGRDLIETVQMGIYGHYVFTVAPDVEHVRLSHGYLPTVGQPRKSTILATREDLELVGKHIHALTGSIIDAARESDIDKVEANTNACHAYHRDCPALKVCRAAQGGEDTLAEYLGVTAADRFHLPVIQPQDSNTGSMTSSLLDFIKTNAVPGTAAPVAPAPAPAAPAMSHDDAVRAEIARLSALVAPAAAAPAPVAASVALATLLGEIEAQGLGMPTFAGEAAKAVAAARGYALSNGAGLAGFGELAKFVFDDPSKLQEILDNAKYIVAQRAAAPAAAPAEVVAEAAPAPTPVIVAPPQTPATEKKKPGRPKKTPAAEAAPVTEAAAIQTVDVSATVSLQPVVTGEQLPLPKAETPKTDVPVTKDNNTVTTPSTSINLYVDCVVDGIVTQSLWPVIDYVSSELTRASGAPDFRFTDKDSKFSFGSWKGALAAGLRALNLPAGNYTLDGAMGDIASVSIEALRDIVRKSGGVFVKGVR